MEDGYRLSAAEAAAFTKLEAQFALPPHPDVIMPEVETRTSGEQVDVAHANALLSGEEQQRVADDITEGSALALAEKSEDPNDDDTAAESPEAEPEGLVARLRDGMRRYKTKIICSAVASLALGGLMAWGAQRSPSEPEIPVPLDSVPTETRLKAMRYSLASPVVLRLTATCTEELNATADYLDAAAAVGTPLTDIYPSAQEYRDSATRAKNWRGVPCTRNTGESRYMMRVDGMLITVTGQSLLGPGIDKTGS